MLFKFKIRIGSLNVRGLGNRLKRKAIFNYLRDKDLDVIFLQETHTCKKNIKLYETEWGSKWCTASCSSNSRGAAILFKPNSKLQIKKTACDHNGRHVICTVQMDTSLYTFCNIYAPNDDSPEFFNSVFKTLAKFSEENIIIGGDFNTVMDLKLDRFNSTQNNNKASTLIKTYMEQYQMYDIWRNCNIETKRYTWFKKDHGNTKASRLDYFLVSAGLTSKVTNTEISSTTRSDHSLIKIDIEDNTFKRGPGIWKLNERLLNQPEFCQGMKDTIIECGAKTNRSHLNNIEKWEFVKKECRLYAQKTAKNTSRGQKTLYENLLKLDHELKHEQLNSKSANLRQIENTLEQVHIKIKDIENERLHSSIYRSRYKWSNYYERMNKHFFAMEKRNYVNKTMFSVIKDDGTICTEQKEILREQELFYQCLYKSDVNVSFQIDSISGNKLTNMQKTMLEQEIEMDEIHKVIMSMKLDKVPGCDGFGIGFYRTFYDELKPYLWGMYREVLETGKFGLTSRKGIISLIPKGNKDSRKIVNLRPLTLLCNDFKILAKVLANRLKLVLPDIIDVAQNGFMPEREIHSNLRNTIDIITHIYQSGKKAVILIIDFLKCFDRIEHQAIFKTMKLYNFGSNFIKWSSIFFNEILICTQNAGYISEFFRKERGINQGCTYSPFCFNLCGELMTRMIKSNPYIKGIKMTETAAEHVISQFADDTGLFLTYTEKCINEALQTLALLESNTGLQISYEKTCIFRIGSLRNMNAKCYTIKPIQWSDGDIPLLGMTIQNQEHQNTNELNVIINKLHVVSKSWQNRSLTLMGKTLLVNTLMSSLYVYKMSVLPMIQEEQCQEFYQIVKNFLWGNKRSKIPLDVLQNDLNKGGLKLTNIKEKQRSLLFKWIKKLCTASDYDYAYQWLVPCMKDKIFKCNLSRGDCKNLVGTKGFWAELLNEWCEFNFFTPRTKIQIENQLVFYNSHLKIAGKVIRLKLLENTPIDLKISDLIEETTQNFLTYNAFCNKFSIHVSWLKYMQLMDAIPLHWKSMLKSNNVLHMPERIELLELTTSKKPSQFVYNFIVKHVKNTDIAKYKNKWETKLHVNIDMEKFERIFRNLYRCTQVTKLRNFQYRLLLNKIFVNDVLSKWKIVATNKCDYCNEKQTILHLMIECHNTKKLWKYLQEITENVQLKTEWSNENIIFNEVVEQTYHIVNLLTLVTKYYIFQQKCLGNKTSLLGLRAEMYFIFKMERDDARKTNKENRFKKRWEAIDPMLLSPEFL